MRPRNGAFSASRGAPVLCATAAPAAMTSRLSAARIEIQVLRVMGLHGSRAGAGLLYDEAVAHRVLGDHAGLDEAEQVVRAAGLGARAGDAVAAEGLAGDHRAGDRAVDVEIADRQPRDEVVDRARVAREQAAGEREAQGVDALDGLVEVPDALDGQQRAEDLVAQ